MTLTFNRRQALTLAAGACAVVAVGWPVGPALAESNGFEKVIADFTGGATPAEEKIHLELPVIADDGNAVPITISVDSPMTEESYVSEVLVVSEANPRPRVGRFYFSPASGIAEVSTRIRLAETQNVIVLAKTNDGQLYTARKLVTVTVGGCGPTA
jgi:sulfur-oxidizing protein SoxY